MTYFSTTVDGDSENIAANGATEAEFTMLVETKTKVKQEEVGTNIILSRARQAACKPQ